MRVDQSDQSVDIAVLERFREFVYGAGEPRFIGGPIGLVKQILSIV
jgi:hypothetical protein